MHQRRRPAAVADPAGEADRRLPAGRQLGPDGAHRRGEIHRPVVAAGAGREQARRRRRDRHRVRGGKLRALCITGAEKFELLADQPTCQAAAPGLVAVNWWGILVPASTPRSVVGRLHGDWVKLAAEADVKEGFAKLGVIAVASTPEEFRAVIKQEMDKYAKLIKEANIKVN